jgi:hypothetical protein
MGENHPQVALVETRGNGVGLLPRDAEDHDETATYNAGDVVGDVTVEIDGRVQFFNPSDGYTPSVADLVVMDVGGGVDVVDRDGTAPDDTADMIFGQVWRVGGPMPGQSGKVAVYRYR